MKKPNSRWRLGVDGVGWLALAVLIAAWPRKAKPVGGLSEDRQMSPADFDRAEPGRGRAAERIRHIPMTGWRDILWRTWLEISADRLSPVAAGLAFYLVLAVFPAIAAFVSLYGLFASVADAQKQIEAMYGLFPPAVLSLVGDAMVRLADTHPAKLSFAFALGLILSIWSAKVGMSALFDALNMAYDETERRPYVERAGLAYAFTAGFVVYAAIVAVLLAAASAVWTPLGWVGVYLLTSGAFAVAYRYGPSRARPRWRWVRVGALAGAGLWLAASLGFSLYLSTVAHYDATYGPIGGVIIFLVWLWLSAMIFLLGAELNAEIEHQTAIDSTTGPPLPMGVRGAVMADTVGAPVSRAAVAKWLGPLGRLLGHPPKP